jgi:hypothetical protein
MSRVEPQLREYFDAGVERISVEDVIAQARVQENRLEPLRSRRTFKPAWAAVGAFAVTILGIGGLAAALKLTERITGEFGSDAAEIVATDGGTLGIWLIAAFVAAAAAAGATWLIRRPAQNDTQDEQDQGKVMVMETIEDTDRDGGTTKETTKPNRWPTVAIAVLAVAVVGLVAWMIFAMRPNSPNAAPPEIAQLMEDYNAAWNAYDADAIEGLVTDGYRISDPSTGVFDHDMESVRTYLMPLFEDWDWQASGPEAFYAVSSDAGNWWYVSGEGSTITRGGVEHAHNGMWTIVEIGDEFLVSGHYILGG